MEEVIDREVASPACRIYSINAIIAHASHKGSIIISLMASLLGKISGWFENFFPADVQFLSPRSSLGC